MCKYNHELCQHDLRGLSKHEINLHYFEFVRNANKEEREEHGYGKGLYKCKICGELSFIKKDNFKMHLKVCKNECNGFGSGRRMVVIGFNNLATTHSHLVKYFVNIEDCYTHTYGSDEKIWMKCPHCSHKKLMRIVDLIRQGFGCPKCGDGVSYPEKVLALILKALGIKYEKQHRFDGYSYKYDFYLIDYDIIIEVHGMQHYWYLDVKTMYNRMNAKGRNGIEEHENDVNKQNLAKSNGYVYDVNYYVIDARESNIDYIRNSIEQCLFFQQFDLSKIDWQEIDKQAQTSQKIDVCRYWKEQKTINKDLTTTDVAEVFGMCRTTILNYLSWGSENCFCEYNGDEERKNIDKKKSKFVYLIKPSGEKWFYESISQRELVRQTGISMKTINRRVIDGNPLTYNGNTKFDPKYIGCRVVLADEYDSQQQNN